MISSRKLEDLHPSVQEKAKAFIAACLLNGIDLLVTSTYRDKESQDALYAIGRTKPGKRVTNARAGYSWHNWRYALDVVPLRNGKPVWSTSGADGTLWHQVGEIGEACGLEWAGRWKEMVETAHFQSTGGLSLSDLRAGKKMPTGQP